MKKILKMKMLLEKKFCVLSFIFKSEFIVFRKLVTFKKYLSHSQPTINIEQTTQHNSAPCFVLEEESYARIHNCIPIINEFIYEICTQ